MNFLKSVLVYRTFTDYTKRGHKEKAYTELVEHHETTSAKVKSKLNALRAQRRRAMAKESKTKSGQAASSNFYEPFWLKQKAEIALALSRAVWNVLLFWRMNHSQRRQALQSLAERKLELFSKYPESMIQPAPDEKATKMSHFS